jgi:hypothetical protein
MGNAIQFGIYRISLIFFSFCSIYILQAQDYYEDTAGVKRNIKIEKWHLNQCFFKSEDKENPLFIDEIQGIYRSQAELTYVPYSNFVKNIEYLNFLMPSIESLRALETDYFKDENFEVWLTNQYVVYHLINPDYANEGDFYNVSNGNDYKEKFIDDNLFNQKGESGLQEIHSGVVFVFHDSVGLNKIVANDIEDDYFKLQISKYTFNSRLNDSIFNTEFKLKQKNFLNFFNEEISPLTAVQYNDEDLADYYISSLRNGGALIVLLNLDKKKIDLYRNSGNTKLADELEEKLNFENKMYARSFLDPKVFDFCKVYLTDAKNRGLVLNGTSEAIFLNQNLEIDSSIIFEQDFVLFARKGQVFETQLADPFNTKKKVVSSNPVVQDAMVIYDTGNVHLLDPFPFFIRASTASYGSKEKMKKSKKVKAQLEISPRNTTSDLELADVANDLQRESELDKGILAVAYSFNYNFYKYYLKASKRKVPTSFDYQWKNTYSYTNSNWTPAPFVSVPRL